jgi:hypothetical protein
MFLFKATLSEIFVTPIKAHFLSQSVFAGVKVTTPTKQANLLISQIPVCSLFKSMAKIFFLQTAWISKM